MRLSDYKEDTTKQEGGSHCYIGEGFFLVRRFGTAETNKQVEDIKRELYGFAPKDIDTNLVLAHWLCEHGVAGWDGILDEEENALEYSQQNARRVLMNPECYLSLNTLLINHANSYSNYLYDEMIEDVETVKKN
jgi:hypothetical protein